MRIKEALSWPAGTLEAPLPHVVDHTPGGLEVRFLKPGKEANPDRRRPNPNDMTPLVSDLYVGEQFKDVWVRLSRVGEKDPEAFIAVLMLVYRSAFLLDHEPADGGGLRYRPRQEVAGAIALLDSRVGDAIGQGGLWGFLHFLDLLGWNEDVKYHVVDGVPSLEDNPAKGRQNTLLTSVSVPFETFTFAQGVRAHARGGPEPDFQRFFSLLQRFLKGRGVCPPTEGQVSEWLQPYITGARTRSQMQVRRPIA